MDARDKDKQEVYEWLRTYCLGHKQARKRREILNYVLLLRAKDKRDRYFRELCKDLRDEKKVASSNKLGYWAIPDNYREDEQECAAILEGKMELRARALTLIKEIDQGIEELRKCIKQGEFKWEE